MIDEALAKATEPFTFDANAMAYWRAAAQGRLVLGYCSSCNRAHHYPRKLCPYCLGPADRIDASGSGVIYSYTIMRRASPQRVLAFVTLDEDVTVMSHIVGADGDALAIGQRVAFEPLRFSDDAAVPVFRPVTDPQAD